TTETLTLKLFRRERAISTFDDTFNPPHRSSPSFSTLVGSDLHGALPPLHPAHASVTWFRVCRRQLRRPVRTRFRFGSAPEALNLAGDGKSPDHYAKGTRSPWDCSHRALTACRRVVSGSVSSPDRGSSHLSLALLGTLSVAREYLALRDGPRGFEPASTCRALLRCRTGGQFCSHTGLSPSMVSFSRDVLLRIALITPRH